MFSRIRSVLATLLFAYAGFSFSEPSPWVLEVNGLGPIKIGMSIEQAEKNSHLKFDYSKPEDPEACYMAISPKLPGISFMIIDNKIARINVISGHTKTKLGASIGMPELNVRQLYDNHLVVDPHKYDEKGNYLTLSPGKEGNYGLRFETSGEKVTRFYAGDYTAVQQVEDCN